MAEAGVLGCDLTPQVPAAALLDFGAIGGGGVLAADGGIFNTAAVGDKDEVIFGQVDAVFQAIAQDVDAGSLLFAAGAVKGHVDDLGVVVELHAEAFQVLDHGQDHRLILVVAGKAQGCEIRQTADMVDITLQVALHLQGAVPVLEGEHRAPVHPEIGVQHLIVEEVGDLFIVQLLIRGHEQLQDLHSALVRQAEFAVGVGILAAVDGGTAETVVGVVLVQPVVLVQHGVVLVLDGGDGAEQVPHALKMVVHFTAAAHDVADVLILIAIAGTAGDGVFFQNVDMLTLHLAVTHQEAGGRQCSQAAADQIGGLGVDAFGLFGGSKSFIITAGIIHTKTSLGFMLTLFLGCCCLGCL